MRVAHIILTAALTSCTWISKDDLAAREPELDNDGDGVVAANDCDDNDADISPKKAETWYDGIDGDCKANDDFDADADGYVATQYAGLQTKGVMGTGILPPGDCDDTDAGVHPGATDAFYDGQDTDCAGNDDFDQDGDGYASRDEPYSATENANGTGTLPNTDCDDTIAEVNPGADDPPYNGTDEDCAGNDDYDQDGDGYYDASQPFFYGATIYAPGTGTAMAGDCDDDNASVHSGAADTFYDGIDTDCAGNDDFDQDFDGFVQDVHLGQMTTYLATSGSLPAGDCNDDPAAGGAFAQPSATEVLSDEIDHDCDALSAAAGAKTFRLNEMEDLNFIGVHTLAFGENTAGIHLAIGADESVSNESGVITALTFDSIDPIGSTPTSEILNEGSGSTSNPFTLASTMSFWVDESVHLSLTGAIFDAIDMRALYLRGIDDVTGSPTGAGLGPDAEDAGITTWEQMSSTHLMRDSLGTYNAVGCDLVTEVLHFNTATELSLVLGSSGVPGYDNVRHTSDFQASRCALLEREGEILILSNLGGDFTASVIDPIDDELTIITDPSETGLPPPSLALQNADVVEIIVPSARAPETVFLVADDFNNDILVADVDFNVIQTMNLALSPVSVDAVFTPDGVLYILAIDDAGFGWLSWGTLSGSLTEPLQLGPAGLKRAALWIDEGTGNILQIAATLDDPTTTEDRIVLGAAYLDTPL